jgi:hypothetical protein
MPRLALNGTPAGRLVLRLDLRPKRQSLLERTLAQLAAMDSSSSAALRDALVAGKDAEVRLTAWLHDGAGRLFADVLARDAALFAADCCVLSDLQVMLSAIPPPPPWVNVSSIAVPATFLRRAVCAKHRRPHETAGAATIRQGANHAPRALCSLPARAACTAGGLQLLAPMSFAEMDIRSVMTAHPPILVRVVTQAVPASPAEAKHAETGESAGDSLTVQRQPSMQRARTPSIVVSPAAASAVTFPALAKAILAAVALSRARRGASPAERSVR